MDKPAVAHETRGYRDLRLRGATRRRLADIFWAGLACFATAILPVIAKL